MDEVKKLHAACADFPLPDLSSPLCIVKGYVEDVACKVRAVGIVRVTSEAILMLDPTLDKRDKLQALQLLIASGIELTKRRGINEWHTFNSGPGGFDELLMDHFDFVRCSGRPLFKEL